MIDDAQADRSMRPVFILMMKKLRGITTIEVMVMTVAISLVILAAYGGMLAASLQYRDIVHRERAVLFAAETLEQLEAMRLTRMQQNYMRSWELFMGNKEDGEYRLVTGSHLADMSLVSTSSETEMNDEDESSLRFYENSDGNDGFYSRLERRIFLETPSLQEEERDQKLVTVSVYWGPSEQYREESLQQVRFQEMFRDHLDVGFAI